MTKVFLDAGLWGWIAAVATLVVVGLIYFRLLGRLAWYCTEQMTHTEPTPEADGAKGSPRDHSAARGARGP